MCESSRCRISRQVDGRLEPLEAGRRPAVEERRPFGRVDEVHADHVLVAEVQQVDRLERHRGFLAV